MNQPKTRQDPLGLHERAISAMLTLVEARYACQPSLSDVADLLDEPIQRLETMFADEHALLVAAAEQALILMIDSCTRAVVRVDPDDPVAQFEAWGNAYLDWAAAYPMQFRLVLDGTLVDALNTPSLRRYVDSIATLMVRMLTRARDNGQLHPKENVDLLALGARAYVTGLARMMVDGRLQSWMPEQDPLVAAKQLTMDFVRRIARHGQDASKATQA